MRRRRFWTIFSVCFFCLAPVALALGFWATVATGLSVSGRDRPPAVTGFFTGWPFRLTAVGAWLPNCMFWSLLASAILAALIWWDVWDRSDRD